MILFYQPDIAQPSHTLDQDESKHCIRVLRMKPGDRLHLTDGKGSRHEAELVDDNPKRCRVKIIDTHTELARAAFHMHIAVAPTKNIGRFEWFLEKATEIGIDEITPVICENSERNAVKIDRLQKVLVAAMKQSLKTFLPRLNEPLSFKQFIALESQGSKFIAYCSDQYRNLLKNIYTPGTDCTVMIGPEGDFSRLEIEEALHAMYTPVSLGKSRLRTETAAVVACHTVQLINE